MESGGNSVVDHGLYFDPSPTLVEAIVDQLQNVLKAVLSERLQLVNANLMGRLETMSQELLSKQEVAFQRLTEALQGDLGAAPVQSKREDYWSISPSETESQKEFYRDLLHRARCASQRETATRLRRLHIEQLIRKPNKPPSDCTVFSCPGALMQRSRSCLDEANSAIDSPGLQENGLNHGKTQRGEAGPGNTPNFKRCSTVEQTHTSDLNGDVDDNGESTDEQNSGMAGAICATCQVLPCSVPDDLALSNVLPSSSTTNEMGGSPAVTEASLLACTTQDIISHEDEQDVDVQKGGRRDIEFLHRVWAFWGIIPWSSHISAQWYRWLVIVFTGCAMVYSISENVMGLGGLFENIANCSLYACAFLNLIFLRHMGKLVGPFEDQFTEYANTHDFLSEWGSGGMKRLLFTVAIWAATASLMCVPFITGAANNYTVILRAWRDGLLLAILHCLWQILAFLELMIDSYCIEFFERFDCRMGVERWNKLQALLRHVSEAAENCFLAVQSATFFAVLCCTAQLVTKCIEQNSSPTAASLADLNTVIFVYTPLLLLGLVATVLFAKAADVSDKCSKVAPLVNSVSMKANHQIHLERQYLVTYILQSDAGFYVKGSRFTKAMLIKSCYLCGTIICGLATTILSQGQKD